MFKRVARIPALTALILGTLLFFPVVFPAQVQAAEKPKAPAAVKPADFPPILESKAYQQFKTRPVSDLSKLIYLIDRFGGAKIEVVYNGHYYKAVFVSSLAKFFLTQNYKKETVNEWIMKWCNVAVPSGNLIWVKFPDNKFKLSRDVLKGEMAELEKVMKAEEAAKAVEEATAKDAIAIVAPTPQSAQALLEKTANAAPPIESDGATINNTQPKAAPALAS